MFAVRQWPGNTADLDFRGVLEGCTAAIVAAAPIEGTLSKKPWQGGISNHTAVEPFLKTDEYAAIAKVLPFCRLWCVRASSVAPGATSFPPISHAHPPTRRPPTNQSPARLPTNPPVSYTHLTLPTILRV